MDEQTKEDWKSVTVNQTNYEIKDVIPNSQYRVQIVTAADKVDKVPEKNTVYTLTPATSKKKKKTFSIYCYFSGSVAKYSS